VRLGAALAGLARASAAARREIAALGGERGAEIEARCRGRGMSITAHHEQAGA
jgi:hypothetical protein